MKFLIPVLLLLSSTAIAQDWIDYKNKTYVGAYYAAVCNVCIQGRYNNDSSYWACTDDREVSISPLYERGCAKAVFDAIIGGYKPVPAPH